MLKESLRFTVRGKVSTLGGGGIGGGLDFGDEVFEILPGPIELVDEIQAEGPALFRPGGDDEGKFQSIVIHCYHHIFSRKE